MSPSIYDITFENEVEALIALAQGWGFANNTFYVCAGCNRKTPLEYLRNHPVGRYAFYGCCADTGNMTGDSSFIINLS